MFQFGHDEAIALALVYFVKRRANLCATRLTTTGQVMLVIGHLAGGLLYMMYMYM